MQVERRILMETHKRLILILFAVAIVIGVTVAVVAAAPSSEQRSAAATPAPMGAASAGDWERIKASGKLVVGTSADYPPFDYYTPDFKLDGFDIALIREIGKQLGVQVQIKDMAFDGLLDAIQLGQIDMAIAAISVTPERDAVLDFTNVYYVGEGAVLARKDSRIDQITSAADVANQRIGVQKGSVYETWLRDNLLDKGLMDEKNLMLYTDVSQAVRDLRASRVDLVGLDANPAADFVAQGGVKIVMRGANRQLYAMAVPPGATGLQDQLNKSLSTLQDQGKVSQLIQNYLKITPDDILPVPTPDVNAPTPTPAPSPTPDVCKDGASYVADLNYDDKNMTAPPLMQPGQAFTKGWRMRNSGTCVWDQTYTWAYAGGNSSLSNMGASAVRVNGIVKPGGTYDFLVPMIAPSVPGVYQGFWNMRDWQGSAFGDRVWVGIQVAGPPTPVPQPTATPAPGVSFWADSTNLQAGQCTGIHWDVQNVQAVYFYQSGQSWENNGVTGKEDRTVCPNQSTSYYLRVVYPNGTSQTFEVRINVAAPPASAPVITSFALYPPGTIPPGTCLDISWDVQGSVSRVSLFYNNGLIWDYAPVRGSTSHCPPHLGVAGYNLQASGPGGTAQAWQYANVVEPVTVQPLPQPK
jgi:ABC-type amino acid transport substrate-binding protein